MIVSVHQPQYIPWLGYLHKIASSDCFVVLDRVQYKPREFQNRNKIRSQDGWMWLSVPVLSADGGRQVISEVVIDNEASWQRKHEASLRAWYGSSPFFKEYFPFFEDLYGRKWESLAELNIHIIRYLLASFSIRTPILFESELNITGTRTSRVIEICKAVKADTYLSGAGGREYLEERLFEENGVRLCYQEFFHPVYTQRFEPFFPYMSALDLLFNHGRESRDILLKKTEPG